MAFKVTPPSDSGEYRGVTFCPKYHQEKAVMEPQLQNWENFCRYQATGDWHGSGYKYSPQGKLIESFRGIRSLRTSEDGSEIYHQNHYTYADGKTVSKTFEPYKKPLTKALFLDHSFSWGSTKIESGSQFGFEKKKTTHH